MPYKKKRRKLRETQLAILDGELRVLKQKMIKEKPVFELLSIYPQTIFHNSNLYS